MIIRAFNEEIEVRGNKETRIREFIISTEREDSHGTVIKMDGWKLNDYNRAGSFFYQHLTSGGFISDPNPDHNLGIGSSKMDVNRLIGVAEFEPEDINPLAEKILKKVDFGSLKRTSVGFLPQKGHWGDEKRGEDPKTYYFDEQTLVEFSIVNIGSNLDAVKKAMEPLDQYLAKQIENHDSEGFKKDFKRGLSNQKRHLDYLFNLGERRKFL